MTPAATSKDAQLTPLNIGEDLERAVLNLIGDLASYLPGGKLVLFEGGGDSDFDQFMTGELFPDLVKGANLISGGHKRRVRDLHEVLDAAVKHGRIPFTVFSITDHDSEREASRGSHQFTWDVYHIENYLLEPKFVGQVVRDVLGTSGYDDAAVHDLLLQSATQTMSRLIRHEMASEINRKLVSSLKTNSDPNRTDTVPALSEAVKRSMERLSELHTSEFSDVKLLEHEAALKTRFEKELANGEWRKTFRGREILAHFASRHVPNLRYELFRNLIISRMRDDGFHPPGMKAIIDRIVSSPHSSMPMSATSVHAAQRANER